MLFTTTRTNGGKTRSKIHVGKMIVGGKMRSCALKKAAYVLLHDTQDGPQLRLFFIFLLLLGLEFVKKTIFPLSSSTILTGLLKVRGGEGSEKTDFFCSSSLLTACLGGGVSQGDGG